MNYARSANPWGPKVLGYAKRLHEGLSPWTARLLPLDVALIGIAVIVATNTGNNPDTHRLVRSSISALLTASGFGVIGLLTELATRVVDLRSSSPKKPREYWYGVLGYAYLSVWPSGAMVYTALAVFHLNNAVSRWIGL